MNRCGILLIAFLFSCANASAQEPADLLAAYAAEDAGHGRGMVGFDAEAGKRFFITRHSDWSCASCHTDNPALSGRHAVTGKSIEPLAPSANPERFRDAHKVEKWFRRNCHDVLKRACTTQEKGDVLAYLLSLARG